MSSCQLRTCHLYGFTLVGLVGLRNVNISETSLSRLLHFLLTDGYMDSACLTLSVLGKISAGAILKYFPYFSQKIGFDKKIFHEISKSILLENIRKSRRNKTLTFHAKLRQFCTKCQSLFYREKKSQKIDFDISCKIETILHEMPKPLL